MAFPPQRPAPASSLMLPQPPDRRKPSKTTVLPPAVPHGLGAARGYSEVRPIGKGSFGVATLVRDRNDNLLVMKSVDIRKLDHKNQADAVNEVKVLASLKHPYIVRYQESFLENGMLAIIMDFAAGGDLLQRIERARKAHQAFTEPQILQWFTQAVLGLKYLHGKQILHRDLKSQNLFLTDRDQLRIGDFGISKMLKRTALVGGNPIGTPYYLSPEIISDTMYSFASDIWALACVLYEMAVLRVPFEAGNFNELIEKITGGPLPQIPFSYSSDLRLLCRDLFNRDHRRRPLSSDIIRRPVIQKEISRMLREAQESESEAASTQPTAPPSVVAEDDQQSDTHGQLTLPPPTPTGRPQPPPTPPIQSQLPAQPPLLPDMVQAPPSTPTRLAPPQSRGRLLSCGRGIFDGGMSGLAGQPAPPAQNPARLDAMGEGLPRNTLLRRGGQQTASAGALGFAAGRGPALAIKGALCRTLSVADAASAPAADVACGGRQSPSRRGRRAGARMDMFGRNTRRTLREIQGFA